MPNASLTVTFGGREVVLSALKLKTDREPYIWAHGDLMVEKLGDKYVATAICGSVLLESRADDAQAAVSALESKLRSLAASIQEVLGEKEKAS